MYQVNYKDFELAPNATFYMIHYVHVHIKYGWFMILNVYKCRYIYLNDFFFIFNR